MCKTSNQQPDFWQFIKLRIRTLVLNQFYWALSGCHHPYQAAFCVAIYLPKSYSIKQEHIDLIHLTGRQWGFRLL